LPISNDDIQHILNEAGATKLKEAVKASDLLKRPEITYAKLEQIMEKEMDISDEVKNQVEIQIKYEGYINKANEQVSRMQKMDNKKIPERIDYDAIKGIASEGKDKLKEVRPLSIGQASRISGVNPADISILLVYIEQGDIAQLANEGA